MGLVVALALAGPEDHFVTDAQSIVTTLKKRSHFTNRTNSPLLEIIRPHRSRIRWHEAHVEVRRPRREWTPDELGNFQADLAAGGEEAMDVPILRLTLDEGKDRILSLEGTYFVDTNECPLVEDPKEYYYKKLTDTTQKE